MNKKIIAIIVILLVAAGGWWFFLKPAPADPSKLTLYGNVDIRQFNVSFQVPGQVTKMYVEEGAVVKAGDLLAEIDGADYQLQVMQADSDIAKANAALAQTQAVYSKYAVLYGQGAISKLSYETAENNFNEAQSVLNAAQTAKDLLVRQQDYSKLYALEGGVVRLRLVEPGTVVQKGTAIYTLSKPNPIWVRAYVNETDLGNIFDGMEAKIITDSVDPKTGEKRTYRGHIGYISSVSEFTPKSVQTTDLRTDLVYQIRVYVDNSDEFLRLGMPTTVILDLTSSKEK